MKQLQVLNISIKLTLKEDIGRKYTFFKLINSQLGPICEYKPKALRIMSVNIVNEEVIDYKSS